ASAAVTAEDFDTTVVVSLSNSFDVVTVSAA
ncbi:hypothetical protein Tco_0571919, partial [Tanacetum coccineum]